MTSFVIRRLLQMIPIVFGITLLVFLLVRSTGDPVSLMLPPDAPLEQREQIRRALGLDLPLWQQYGIFLTGIVQGDFGESVRYRGQDVLSIVIERLPATLELSAAALVVAIGLSLPIGLLSALHRNSWLDRLASTMAILARAMPNFWLGIMLILAFSVVLGWLPVSGRGGWAHVVLPALTLGTSLAALLMRMMRSSMLEVLGQDYVRTAKAKGLAPRRVVLKHALRNGLVAYLAVVGVTSAELVAGAVVTEQVFAWPGVGLLAVQAVNSRDMAVVQAIVVLSSIAVMLMNLLVDVAYALVDPRISYS